MYKEQLLLLLWIIYGFFIITGVDALIYSMAHGLFFVAIEFGISIVNIMIISPLLTISIYALVGYWIFIKVKSFYGSNPITNGELPKRSFLIASGFALLLYPVTNKLAGLALNEIGNSSKAGTTQEILAAYTYMEIGMSASQIIVLILLGVIFLKEYKLLLIKEKQRRCG